MHFLDNLSTIIFKEISIIVAPNNVAQINLYKIHKIVFCNFGASNLKCGTLIEVAQLPKEFIPNSNIIFPLGNGKNNDYTIRFQSNGIIDIYGNNVILNNLSSRTVTYFTK